MSAEIVGAGALLILAVVHSLLGEQKVIGPLLAANWEIPIVRRFADRLIRFAWHLTSLAWVALAVVLLDGPISVAMVTAAGVPAIALFLTLRTHLAWPLFALVALVGLWSDGAIGNEFVVVVAAASVILLGLAAVLHLYWALGGRRLVERVVPVRADDGAKAFVPRRWMTLAVAAMLAGFAALVATVAAGEASTITRALVASGALVLAARAVGDNRYAGFTKSVRNTAFAVADDRYLTPLAVFLAFGSVAALLVV